jgi:hypothetical protein
MPMLPTLTRSEIRAQCDRCRTVFDPVYGGVCESCGRLLCGRCVYGSVFRRLQSYLPGAKLICTECRAAIKAGRPIPGAKAGARR